jgi:hypothetical protein
MSDIDTFSAELKAIHKDLQWAAWLTSFSRRIGILDDRKYCESFEYISNVMMDVDKIMARYGILT